MPVLEFGATTIGLITREHLWPEVLWSKCFRRTGPRFIVGLADNSHPNFWRLLQKIPTQWTQSGAQGYGFGKFLCCFHCRWSLELLSLNSQKSCFCKCVRFQIPASWDFSKPSPAYCYISLLCPFSPHFNFSGIGMYLIVDHVLYQWQPYFPSW